MRTLTLDTNCILAIDERRPEAVAVRALADAHAAGEAHVAVVAISASEQQKGRLLIQNFAEFCARLATLDLGHLDILRPMSYLGISFWDWCLWSDDDMQALERQIHAVLFPDVEFVFEDYCRVNGLDPGPSLPPCKWRNCKCDVQAIWTDIHGKRDVFVTSDKKYFHKSAKKAALISLGAKAIEYPKDAISLL